MRINLSPSRCWLIVLPLMLLLAGCTLPRVPTLPDVAPAQIPPLSPEATPPKSPPTFCNPSCLRSLTVERENWHKRLMPDSRGGTSAQPSTTR
jgi:hypothetical protein